MGFLEKLQEQTQEAESPRSFFLWSGLAAISAVTRKNTFINKQIYKLYPNIYVMLVARSGLRKGFPVKLAQRLVESQEVTKVISGRNSIQAIIQELGKQYSLESGKVLTGANAFLVNDELGTFLVDDPAGQKILTTLYDSFYHQNWTSTLKHDGRTVLKDINITMLSATNETHLDAFLDETSIAGGFMGRTLVVRETQKSRLNPLIDSDEMVDVDYSGLKDELKRISLATGQVKICRDAKDLYKLWYSEYNKTLEENPDNDPTGLSERLHDHVLKIAHLLSLSDSNDLYITRDHTERAIELCTGFIINTKLVVSGKGKSENANKNKILIDYLLSQPGYAAERRKILSAKYGDLDAIDLNNVVDTLSQAGIIEQSADIKGAPIYRISDKFAEQFKAAIEQRRNALNGKRVVEY